MKSLRFCLFGMAALFQVIVSIRASAYAQSSSFVPDEIIVQFQDGVIDFPVNSARKLLSETNILIPQIRDSLAVNGVLEVGRVFRHAIPHDTLKTIRTGERIRIADASQIYKFKITGDVLKTAPRLQRLSLVVFAEPNYLGSETIIPNDDHFAQGNQWGLHNTGQFGYTVNVDVDAPQAWDISTGSSNVLIGVIDSGIDYTHPDLGADFGSYPNQKIVTGYDFVNDDSNPIDDRSTSHGTATSGIIGALTNNDDGEDHKIAGIGGGWGESPYGFKLLPVKVIDQAGDFTIANLADGIQWAAVTQDAEVLNMSLATNADESNLLRFAITEAYNVGTIAVCAMGNSNTGAAFWPAAYDNSVISVGAIEFTGQRIDPSLDYTWGSNLGPWIDVMAPGTAHWTTARMSLGKYRSFDGTSCSAPFVSGFAGIILSVAPTASFEKVEAIIRASGTTYPNWNSAFGYGYIKMRKGLDLLTGAGYTEFQRTATGGTATNENFTVNPGDGYTYKRFKVVKTVTWSEAFTSVPVIWGRRTGSNGRVKWPSSTAQLGYTYTGIVAGTEAMNSCQLVSYIYEKRVAATGQYIGWYPVAPGSVTYAYTLRGILNPPSVTITGPTMLEWKALGTWTANPSGGNGSYTYEWRFREAGEPNWSGVAGTSQQYTRQMLPVDMELQVKVTSNGQIVYDTHYVEEGFNKASAPVAEESSSLPEVFSLSQNYPNPFNRSAQSSQQNLATSIRFGLPEATQVQLVIFDLMGREVQRLADQPMTAGYHEMTWDGKDQAGRLAPAGVYFYQIIAGDFREWKKLAVVR